MLGRLTLRARAAALLPLASFAVHELRYRLAYGSDAGAQLARQGHAYQGALRPLLAIACALAAAELLSRLARAWRIGDAEERAFGRRRLWALVAVALVAIYVGQELLEGMLANGHPGGLAGVLGAGGWLALPLSALIGGALTLVLSGARAAVLALARRRRTAPAPREAGRPHRPPLPVHLARRLPLAAAAAGRAPPAVAAVSLT